MSYNGVRNTDNNKLEVVNMKFKIFAVDREKVEKVLNKLCAKADKYNVEFGYAISDTPEIVTVQYETTGFDGDRDIIVKLGTKDVEALTVEMSDTLICNSGWTVAAHLEHMQDDQNIVTLISHNCDVPSDWYTMKGGCDHCNTNRHRAKTFIVSNGKEYKQVGSACLKDYTGIAPQLALSFATVQELVFVDDKVYSADYVSGLPRSYNVMAVLEAACMSIDYSGYHPSGATQPTKKRVAEILESGICTSPYYMKALSVYNYLCRYEGSDNLMQNQANLVRSGYCKRKHFGILCYAPIAVQKSKERKANAGNSSFVGEIGERQTFIVKEATLVCTFETDYGSTKLYKFKDDSGNTLVWFASKYIDLDGITSIKGTVKEHKEYDGEKQTVLTRCITA